MRSDKEIKEGLRRCERGDCDDCPYRTVGDCGEMLLGDALALIERLEEMRPICKIGDKVYSVEDCDGEHFIEELSVTEVGTRYIFCSACVPAGDDIDNEIPIDRIGRDLFLTREAAGKEILRRSASMISWVSVEDALPEDDDEYMVWIVGADKPTVLYFDTTEKEFFEDTEDGYICYSVTKWAEMPRC